MTNSLTPPPEFHETLAALGIDLESGDVDRLGAYLELLLEANKSFNLTAVKDPKEAWSRHIADSLSLLPFLVSCEAKRVIDVGSGGGLPGMALAIVMPEVQFTLLEATGKKATFLESVRENLGLKNVQVIKDRAETLGQDLDDHREAYDVAIARAVGRLAVLLELTVPLVRIGGHVLAIKGKKAPEEIEEAKQALHRLHSGVADVVRGETGTVVVIEKHRKTPKIYPRFPGEPKRVPLGVKRKQG